MRKFLSVLLLCVALLSVVPICAAELLSVKSDKTGIMLYDGTGQATVDEGFQFTFIATGDTQKVLLQGAGEPVVVAESVFGNQGPDETIGLETIVYASNVEGKRVFRFWAVGYDGTQTPYEKQIEIMCYKEDGGENTVYSVDLARDVVKEIEGGDDSIEMIELTICTSINTREIRVTTETGTVINNLSEHCKQRGTCDIKNGKKYWEVYFTSKILGERAFTFQALKNGNPVGEAHTVHFKVLSWQEWDKQGEVNSGGSSVIAPGTDAGKDAGDDKNATGTEDGVENGGDGKSDTDINTGSKEEGENTTDNNEGENIPVTEENPKEEPKEEPKEDEKQDKEETKPQKPQGTTEGSDSTGSGSCCREEDFLSFGVPAHTATIVIELPTGEKYNAVDQEKKGLALRKTHRDGSFTWIIWTGQYRYNDVKITVYNTDYEPMYNETIAFRTNPFTDEEREYFEEGIEEELRIQNRPKTKVVRLVIGSEIMTVDGKEYEVDPGRGTKPLIIDGRTMLPIRAIIEALGGEISWNEKQRRVDIDIFNRSIRFWIDSTRMTWNNIPETVDVPPQIINDRTMLPIRFVAECLDHTTVEWHAPTQTVTITYSY